MKLEFKEALDLCEQVRANNRKRFVSFNKMWCWGCAKFSKSPEKRCFANSEDRTNNGCILVNNLYKKLKDL
ncbi:MAG: hypothetical protein ACW97V_13635 [Promethearchaeota archaeon]